jgi:hypothetical protein
VNLAADSTPFLELPLAATARTSRDVGEAFWRRPLPNSAKLFLLGAKLNGGQLVLGVSGVAGCGLRVLRPKRLGEYLSERTMMRVETSTSENTSATLPNLAG